MPKVYLSQQAPSHVDMTEALKYGKLVPIFTGNVYPDSADEVMRDKLERAKRVLESYNPKEDTIGLVGAPLFAAATGFILGRYSSGPMTMLRYDRLLKGYYPITID